MSRNLKLSGAIVARPRRGIAVLAIAIDSPPRSRRPWRPPTRPRRPPPVVAENTHKLSAAEDGKVTLVEFLDFECESCGAIYPAIEELREQYEGRVTFAIRYFPNDGHFNAMIAAQAVEAASKQGKLEAMYQRMFETQREWGEAQRVQARGVRRLRRGPRARHGPVPARPRRPRDHRARDRRPGRRPRARRQGTPTIFLNEQHGRARLARAARRRDRGRPCRLSLARSRPPLRGADRRLDAGRRRARSRWSPPSR